MKSNVSIARLPNGLIWVMSEMSTMFQMTQHFPRLTTWLDAVSFGTFFFYQFVKFDEHALSYGMDLNAFDQKDI